MDFQQLTEQRYNPELVALTLHQPLRPERQTATGEMVVSPATYDKGVHNLTELPDGHNLCTIDSIPSQANRMEKALFEAGSGSWLPVIRICIPDVGITTNEKSKALLAALGLSDLIEAHRGERQIDLCEAPHRLADALVRFSGMNRAALQAFLDFDKGDAHPVARLSPFSLLFGAWDSHLSQIKIPRVLTAEIIARDVTPQRRRGFYMAKLTGRDLPDLKEAANLDTLSEIGLDNAGNGENGMSAGVIVRGGIYRDAAFNLVALRANSRCPDADPRLQDYLFWLGLAGLLIPQSPMLRQGCTLLPQAPATLLAHFRDGRSEAVADLALDALMARLQAAAAAFFPDGMPRQETTFERSLVGKALESKPAKGGKSVKPARKQDA